MMSADQGAYVNIAGKAIGDEAPCFIIAEAGINHNGSMETALELIRSAHECGADCIKFQTFDTEASESRLSTLPGYFENCISASEKLAWSKSMEFNKAQFQALLDYCQTLGIVFLSTACDLPSLNLLVDIGCQGIKIGSSDTNNDILLRAVGQTGLPVLLSTGISTLDDIEHALSVLKKNGSIQIGLLQCTSQYPAAYGQINLRVIETFRRRFNVPVGLSDHSIGIHVAAASVALGARIIEKHFTLDRTMPGVDHKASIEPAELKAMVRQIREVEKALGDGVKCLMPDEKENAPSMRKSLFTAETIAKGTPILRKHLTVKRPGTGIPPTRIEEIIGMRASKDIDAGEMIRSEDLDGV